MADSIVNARVIQFKGNVLHLYQQTPSKLKGLVREEMVVGKSHMFERLASTAMVPKTTRNGDTPLVQSQHSRRMVSMLDYEWADLVDQQDKIRLLITPESEYAVSAAAALRRQYDTTVITAFDANSFSGEDGSTTVTFASEIVGSDTDLSAAAVTTPNILTIKLDFDNLDIPEDGRVACVPPAFITQLLGASAAPIAASSDYNTIKALVQGTMDTWVGFKWVTTNLMPLLDSNDKYSYFYHRDAMGVAMGKDMVTRITERDDKSYATQVYVCSTFGATRIQKGVARRRINSNL